MQRPKLPNESRTTSSCYPIDRLVQIGGTAGQTCARMEMAQLTGLLDIGAREHGRSWIQGEGVEVRGEHRVIAVVRPQCGPQVAGDGAGRVND